MKQGLIFIVSAPAGTGKTTLVDMLTDEFKGQVIRSVTCTTRSPRPGEVDGIDYHFLTDEEYSQKQAEGAFLESADVFTYHYGTLKEDVMKRIAQGLHVVLVIDVQGARQVMSKLDTVSIFIQPPSFKTLQERLQGRGTEDKEMVKVRLDRAEKELQACSEYDYVIVNDDLEDAYKRLKTIVLNEAQKGDE